MICCRPAVSRGSRLALRRSGCARIAAARRGLASGAGAAATVHAEPAHQRLDQSQVSPQYQSATAAGVKFASRSLHPDPTTRLAVVVKAGTRHQMAEGLIAAMEGFAFKNTTQRSALRMTREAELLGGQLTSYHTREALVLQASFLRDDLPYFTELLANVIADTKYTTHEFHDDVLRVIRSRQAKLKVSDLALDSAHAVAFHAGLGFPLYPSASTPLHVTEHHAALFSELNYNKANIAVVADGANPLKLTRWLEAFFSDIPESASASSPFVITLQPSKYFGGENRTAHQSSKSAVTIAFPGYSIADSPAKSADTRVLVSLLGGQSAIKWSPGFSLLSKVAAEADGGPELTVQATNLAYSDAGLLAIQISGAHEAVGKAAAGATKALKSVADGSGVTPEDLTKAIARAKYDLLEASEAAGAAGIVSTGMNLIRGGQPLQVHETLKALGSVTVDSVKQAAKDLLEGKAAVATIGDLMKLPYAAQIGLNV